MFRSVQQLFLQRGRLSTTTHHKTLPDKVYYQVYPTYLATFLWLVVNNEFQRRETEIVTTICYFYQNHCDILKAKYIFFCN